MLEIRGGGHGGGTFRGGPTFKSELLAKFPPFDPAWSDELKAEWFKGFQQFMALAKDEE